MKKCEIICNLHSGENIKRKSFINSLVRFEKILEENDYESHITFTEYKGHAKEIMMNIVKADLVISLGGDGTFNEVMTGNLKRENQLLLSHIPIGTTNDVGTMFGYNKNLLDNLKILLDGVVRGIDICSLNNEPFVYVAGFGKFMNVPYETPRSLKIRYGRIAYIIQGVKDFFNKTKLHDLTYTVDGETYRGLYSLMIISNANRIAGINNFYKEVKLNDDKFEVLVCNLTRRQDIIKSLLYLRTNDITKVPGFYFHRAKNLKVTFHDRKRKTWCIDGEEFNKGKNEFEVKMTRDVQILLPQKNIHNLFVEEK